VSAVAVQVAMEPDASRAAQDRLIAWIEQELGGAVEHCERQMRSRPAWFVDLRRRGERIRLYARGARTEDIPSLPLQSERGVLELLRGSQVRVPKVYGFCPDPKALILESVEGRTSLANAESDQDRGSVIEDLAEQMVRMHEIETAPFRRLGLGATSDHGAGTILPSFLRSERHYLLHKSASDPRIEFLRRWVHRNTPKHSPKPCFIHGDPGQFVFQNGRITAMLDFEHADIGHAYMDLGGLRLRALHEPMGDISALFRRYAQLTDKSIDRDLLSFYTVNFIARTAMSYSTTLAKPAPEVDYPGAVSAYIISVLFSAISIAERMNIALEKPAKIDSGRRPRWPQVFDVLGQTLAGRGRPRSVAAPNVEEVRTTQLARFALRRDQLGLATDRRYVEIVENILGIHVSGWEEADEYFEKFVVESSPAEDARIVQVLYLWCWDQLASLEDIIENEMWKMELQPISELI
jgi:aminoglycoside phosphotransferase (APT) family kinase protein